MYEVCWRSMKALRWITVGHVTAAAAAAAHLWNRQGQTAGGGPVQKKRALGPLLDVYSTVQVR